MGGLTNEKPAFQAESHILHPFDLFNQGHRIYDHTIADHTIGIPVKNSGWDEVENDFFVIEFEGMTGVGSTLKTNHKVRFRTEKIDDLTFTFIAPLGTNYNSCTHK